MNQTIAIDMDEVIADALSRFILIYNEEFGANLATDQIVGRKFRDVVPVEHHQRVDKYPSQSGFFRDLPVVENSQEVIKRLMGKYNIFITTAAMEFPTSFADKFDWMNKHFPFISWRNIVFCGDKSIIAADYLIDDNVRHFARFKGEGIVFTAPHNINERQYRRVNNWLEVQNLFLDS